MSSLISPDFSSSSQDFRGRFAAGDDLSLSHRHHQQGLENMAVRMD